MANLRISINAKKIEGPYGGGNQFAKALEKFLINRGYEVYRRLVPNLDIIQIVSSESHLKITSYNIDDIIDYISINPQTRVVHRVNTADEPRGSNLGINDAVLNANKVADYTIFVSSFVKDLFAGKGLDITKPNCVILNGADEEIFNPINRADWSPNQKLKIVTHHWSSNFMKGFDIYERLDQILENHPYKDMFEFTIIGNVPHGINLKNTKVLPPMFGTDLALQLKQNHIYITAARNEPGPNHCVEGMRCGLPVLFLKSGALSEYCKPYGIEFYLVNFEEKLLEMREAYPRLREEVLKCPYTAKSMCEKYEQVFMEVMNYKKTKISSLVKLSKQIKNYAVYKPKRKIGKSLRLLKRAINYL